MSNKFTYQVLRDTTTDSVIKVTGTFDGSGQEANTSRIQANSLYGALATTGMLVANSTNQFANTTLPYYDLQLTGLKYFVNFPTNNVGGVEIFWSGNGTSYSTQYANSATIVHLNGQGEMGMGEQLPSVLNNSGATANGYIIPINVGNGDIGVATQGATANSAYTLIIQLRKNNQHYQRGQFNEPAAFNFGNYKTTP